MSAQQPTRAVTPEQVAALNALAHVLGQMLGKVLDDASRQMGLANEVGYTVALFTYGPGFLTYLSSAQREASIAKLRELIDELEKAPAPPRLLVH